MRWRATALCWLIALPAFAHEMRPAYLELREENPGAYSVLWKTPMRGDERLAVEPQFSGKENRIMPVTTRTPPGAAVQTWRLLAPGLRGQTVRILGLERTMTDALVRFEFADGTTWMQRLTARQPSAVIPARQSVAEVSSMYLFLGAEHILTGIDHLLFVLGLIIITRGGWNLVKTVTAFTLSHSITLTAATLGFVRVPQRPVEATIALSILFLAAEIVRSRQGTVGVAARWPWVVAFTFGLLHGLGFAGGLNATGLPAAHIPTALLFFSGGVEIGHFSFVAAVLGLWALLRCVPVPIWAWRIPSYAIGTVSAFWLIQRVAGF